MIQDNECMYIIIVCRVLYDAIFLKRRIIIFSYEYDRITFLKINLESDVYKSKHFLFICKIFIYMQDMLYNIIVIININRKIISRLINVYGDDILYTYRLFIYTLYIHKHLIKNMKTF